MQTNLPLEVDYPGPLPEIVYGYVSVTSQGERSIFEAGPDSLAAPSEPFHGTPADHDTALATLENAGFSVLAQSPLGLAVAGPPDAYERLTGGNVVRLDRFMHAESGRQRYVTHLDIRGQGQPDTLGLARPVSADRGIEAVLIERPRMAMGVFPSAIPPTVPKYHLRLPDDVAVGLGATAAHRMGVHGDNVIVAMVDTGHYRHPYFTAHSYHIEPAISLTGADPTEDPVGHGTGESANIFAVAPGAILRPYRASDTRGRLVAAIGSFLRAKQDQPGIITCSWGGDLPYNPHTAAPDPHDLAWALEIKHAVELGILVVFSAGNGQFSIEPQVSGVLAAGGTYMVEDGSLVASNYASGYPSPWFDQVQVPTVCGLVGVLPRAQYLMLPIPPGCTIDVHESQPAPPQDPTSDGTSANDGWALFSGTSAAAPQLAGAAALLLSANPHYTPAQVIQALTASAVDITTGRCHPRFNYDATQGRDFATGFGLINVSAALNWASQHP